MKIKQNIANEASQLKFEKSSLLKNIVEVIIAENIYIV
jgi:hypothetical protein